jgi:autotransporter-associated beta strand protein
MTTPNTITLLGNTTVTSHVTTSFFNVMSGAFSLTKQGPGSLRVSATNTYSGGTTVASGTLEFGRTSSLGTGTVMLGSSGGGNASLLNYLGGWTLSNNVIVAADSGGTLTLGYTSGADFSGIFEGTITLNDHLTLRSDAVDGFAMRITGAISGAYNLTKTGTGMVRIEANNTGYSGTTTISAGTLQLGSFAGSASGSIGNGEIINNAALRINRSNAFTLSNLISGSGAVAQTGAGTTTLSNANTYSGGTSVSGGSLFVTNTTGSATGTGALTTASSTILGGTGMISPTGANGISIAGSVAPGVSGSAGTLTFTPADGNVIFQSGSSVVFELFGNGSNDKLVLNASGSGVIDFSALTAGSLGVTFAAGYTPALGHSFDLLDWAAVSGSGISGLSASLLNASTAGFDPSWIWDTSAFASDGMITIVLVPEPTRTFLAALGLMALTLRRQR